MFTDSASCLSHSYGNSTYELLHELPSNLGLMIIGNEELLRLLTRVFIDLMILELVTRRFGLITRGFEPLTRGFELVTRGFELRVDLNL